MNWDTGAEQFVNALASDAATPGGGAAAALAGAMGCALLMMAAGTTRKRKNTDPATCTLLTQSLNKLSGLHSELKSFMQQDALAYDNYLRAAKLPKDDPARPQRMQEALEYAARVPADTAHTCELVLKELSRVQAYIAPVILSDVACARHLLRSAIACSVENIRANLTAMTDKNCLEKWQQILQRYTDTL